MVTMIVTKVVECSRLSVRMGQKKKQEWVGKGRKALPHVFAQSSPLIFSHSHVFFCLSQLIVWKRHKKLVIYIVIFKLQSATVFLDNRVFKIQQHDRKENVKKTIGLISKTTTFITLFVHLFAIFVLLRYENT